MTFENDSYLELGNTEQERLTRYRHYLGEPSDKAEAALIREGLQRNQPTGNSQFIDEAERRAAMPIRIKAGEVTVLIVIEKTVLRPLLIHRHSGNNKSRFTWHHPTPENEGNQLITGEGVFKGL